MTIYYYYYQKKILTSQLLLSTILPSMKTMLIDVISRFQGTLFFSISGWSPKEIRTASQWNQNSKEAYCVKIIRKITFNSAVSSRSVCKMWKFHDFSGSSSQILCQFNLWKCRSSKTAIFAILLIWHISAVSNKCFAKIHTSQNSEPLNV